MADTMADTSINAIELATAYLTEHGYLGYHSIEVRAMILYGSRVYNTATVDSDHDYLVIVDSVCLLKEIGEEIGIHHLEDSSIEVSIVSTFLFDQMLESCKVRAMESIFTPEEYVPIGMGWVRQKRREFATTLEADRPQTLNRIRSAFSGVSSNSEVKARKKVRDSEYMVGLKSEFHSIRLLMFGVQIGETGEIFDFEAGTDCWAEIVSTLIPKIADETLTPGDCKAFYKKWAKTKPKASEGGESLHLLSRFKDALPKL